VKEKESDSEAVGRDGGDPLPGRKRANSIDAHVGNRVRLRRMLNGMSQERLGELMGLTFQQIQKYEKGVNRIGAGRLYRLSKVLGVPVQFFFDEAPPLEDAVPAVGFAEQAAETYVVDFLNTREGLELNRAFVQITDHTVRKRVVDLVKSLAGQASEAGGGPEGQK
jgi:transcriptional regulator with XRE-family HTH domain